MEMLPKPYLLKPMYDPTEPEIDYLIADLIEWSKKDTSLRADDFIFDRDMGRQRLHELMAKWPKLAEAYQAVKLRIASRREIGALLGKYNASFVLTSMPMHDKDWKDMYEWKAKLAKQDELKNTGPQIVVIERAPNSEMVPERKKNDEEKST